MGRKHISNGMEGQKLVEFLPTDDPIFARQSRRAYDRPVEVLWLLFIGKINC